MKPTILAADDDTQILTALKLLLVSEGMILETASTPAELLERARHQTCDLILMDLNYSLDTTSGREGLNLLGQLKSSYPNLPMVVMTGYGTVALAVEALKLGAADFIQKPWDNERLLTLLRTQIRLARGEQQQERLTQENRLLRRQLADVPGDGLIAASPVMKQLLEQVEQLSRSDMNMLITGENGTGKSLLAAYIHGRSSRADNHFLAVNMGAISDNLFESEMFGHVRGAFTDAREERIGRFEMANGGTLFLDEIATIPMAQQAKLLRVLEERNFERVGSSKTQVADVRIISATNADLEQRISEGRFRQDLLYRLKTVAVEIPTLRERQDDIEPLAAHFLAQHARKYAMDQPELSAEALLALRQYDWPGNVRELNHLLERALFMQKSGEIGIADLGLPQRVGEQATDSDDILANAALTLEQVEQAVIRRRMIHFEGDAQKTARSLGLSRSAFYRRLNKLKL